jgi:hypothetical protein
MSNDRSQNESNCTQNESSQSEQAIRERVAKGYPYDPCTATLHRNADIATLLAELRRVRAERDAAVATLKDIEERDPECLCAHDTDECCGFHDDFWCAHCIAGRAIAKLGDAKEEKNVRTSSQRS